MVRTSDVKKSAVIYNREDGRTFTILGKHTINTWYCEVEGDGEVNRGLYITSELTGYTKDLIEFGIEEEEE